MRLSNYKCEKCGHVFEYAKIDDLAGFPESVECEECKGESKRVWGFATFDVAQGKLGNSKDGYRSGCVSHPSQFGKYKGARMKKS